MDRNSIQTIIDIIENAKCYADIFGLVDNPKDLQVNYHNLTKLVFPDHAPVDLFDLASRAFQLVNDSHTKAKQALADGTYLTHFKLNKTTLTISSPLHKYEVYDDPTNGDFTKVYLSTDKKIIKVSKSPKYNSVLQNEFTFNNKTKYTPDPVEIFEVINGGKNYVVAVYKYDDGYVTLKEIHDRYPDGIDVSKHSWIFRRILGQCMLAHHNGLVNCAITPEHILVHPINREPLHLGWAHALKIGTKPTRIIKDRSNFYPKNLLSKNPVDSHVDLYMAGQTMLYLIDNSKVDKEVLDTINKLSLPKTKLDVIFEDLTQAIRNAYGRTYNVLEM